MNHGETVLQQHRNQLLQLYRIALDAVSGEAAVRRFLQQHPITETCSLVAIGKAAAAMAKGAQHVLGERLRSALVITKQGHSDPTLNSTIFLQLESSHPVPDESSLSAGAALLQFLAELPQGEPLLFLLSGGASALVEVLPVELSASQLSDLNHWLLASALPISEMNAIRKRLSRIKGGKLIPHLEGRPCLQLLLSDVPGDELGIIGSGPLIVERQPSLITAVLPSWLETLLSQQPDTTVSETENIESHIIASNGMARDALVVAAQKAGLNISHHPGHFQGDVQELAAQFCEELLSGPAALYLWGGEGSMLLPAQPGRGGRNQQLALGAARYLAGHDNVVLLAVGTDGTDGPTEDAGALVDGGTVQRGVWEGLDPLACLEQADAGDFLEASGDLVQTGPTGTNVMDLVVAWKW